MAGQSCKGYKGLNSALFLSDTLCLAKFNAYSIRFHDATNEHLDYAIGNPSNAYCMDFIVPKTFQKPKQYKKHQFKGMNNKTLPAKTIALFKPNLPERAQSFRLIFQEAHPVEYITATKGLVHEIKSGYGAGEWFVVENGSAWFEIDGNKITVHLGKRAFYITKGSYNLMIGR